MHPCRRPRRREWPAVTKPARGSRFSDGAEPAPSHAAPTRAIQGTRAASGHLRGSPHTANRVVHGLPALPARPVPAAQRFGLAAAELAAAGLAFGAFLLIWTSVARSVPAMQVLAWFGALCAAALTVVAVARAVRARYPEVRTTTVDGRSGVGIRAWSGEYWLEVVIDSALALLCVGVLIADLASGGHWFPWTLVLLVPAAWFGGLSVLALTHRRNPEAIWVVDDDLVHESWWGRERAPLNECESVEATGSAVVLTFAEPTRRRLCPKPWGAAVPASTQVRINARELGLRPSDLATWLATAAPAGCVVTVEE